MINEEKKSYTIFPLTYGGVKAGVAEIYTNPTTALKEIKFIYQNQNWILCFVTASMSCWRRECLQ